MIRRVPIAWLVGAIILIPGAAGIGWWFYGPTYQRNHLLRVAENGIQSGNLPRAKEALERLLQEDPNQVRVQFLYAQVLRHQGRRDDAWVALYAAMQLGLPEPEGRREYALLEAAGDFPLAEKALGRVLEDQPEDLEVLRVLAEGYAKTGRWPDAERAYTRWLEIEPDQADAHLGRGHARLEAGRFNPAAADFREVLAISPKHFQARLSLAQCLLSDFQIEEAEAELFRCRDLLPARSEPLVGLAACSLERGDQEKALTLAKEALALEPASTPALTLLGNLYLRRQRYDLAIPVFERVIRLNPRDKQGHLNLAQALTKTGELKKAGKHEEIFQQLDREERKSSNK
jgi:tetratricopeptide (TPR) repeat protein